MSIFYHLGICVGGGDGVLVFQFLVTSSLVRVCGVFWFFGWYFSLVFCWSLSILNLSDLISRTMFEKQWDSPY